MKCICEHCGEIIGETEWILQISKPSAYKSYYACSEECFKNILHKQGIATYPIMQPTINKDKKAFIFRL